MEEKSDAKYKGMPLNKANIYPAYTMYPSLPTTAVGHYPTVDSTLTLNLIQTLEVILIYRLGLRLGF